MCNKMAMSAIIPMTTLITAMIMVLAKAKSTATTTIIVIMETRMSWTTLEKTKAQ
jgi:hypothetical protein